MRHPRRRPLPGWLPWTTLLQMTTVSMSLIPGIALLQGPDKWHQGVKTYAVINRIHFIPWSFYGLLLVVAGVMSWTYIWRPIGYFLGGVVWSFFAICTWWTILTGEIANVMTPPGLTALAVMYWLSLRWLIYARSGK
jgi:hypothetical protein